MDKFRINYKCNKMPKANSGLEGFTLDRTYTGRSFNGLFEVTPQWGNGKQTKLLQRQEFEEYFEVIPVGFLHQQSA
ncbi:hypothetical protein D770_14810 [Flammeovirgaceae bacterium 311]|nr:hypothetical protein D770_14810 [Flammeovirgaceae bacterium 311]